MNDSKVFNKQRKYVQKREIKKMRGMINEEINGLRNRK